MAPSNQTPVEPRRRRIHILQSNQSLSELDLYPGDEVWASHLGPVLGRVDGLGNFIAGAGIGLS